jgi:hypothetical protein
MQQRKMNRSIEATANNQVMARNMHLSYTTPSIFAVHASKVYEARYVSRKLGKTGYFINFHYSDDIEHIDLSLGFL